MNGVGSIGSGVGVVRVGGLRGGVGSGGVVGFQGGVCRRCSCHLQAPVEDVRHFRLQRYAPVAGEGRRRRSAQGKRWAYLHIACPAPSVGEVGLGGDVYLPGFSLRREGIHGGVFQYVVHVGGKLCGWDAPVLVERGYARGGSLGTGGEKVRGVLAVHRVCVSPVGREAGGASVQVGVLPGEGHRFQVRKPPGDLSEGYR